MKICMVTDTYHPTFDGIVRYLDYLIPALLLEEHEVTVVCPHFSGYKRASSPSPGLKIIRSRTTRFKINAYHFALPDSRLLLAILRADAVVLHSLMPLGAAGGILAKVFQKKVVLFCHHDERVILQDIIKAKPFFIRICFWLIRRFYRHCIDLFFHATERFKRKLLFFGVPSEKIIYTPFGIDTKTFHPSPKINLREKYKLPPEALIATYLGRLSIEKNIETIIQALDAAMDNHPNLRALISGDGPDKKLLCSQPRNNNDRFIFTGFVPEEELQSHYASSDLFVTPTHNESSCFTVFEAMTCMVPVIIAEKDHDQEIIHKKNALLITNVHDIQEIKESILLLAQNEQLRQEIAYNGHQLITSRTWDNHVKKFLQGIEDDFDHPSPYTTKESSLYHSSDERKVRKRVKKSLTYNETTQLL